MPGFLLLGGLYFVVLQAVGGAQEALSGALDLLTRQTTIQLEGNNWFIAQFGLIRTMAVWVMMPLMVIAIIHSIAKGSMAMLLRSAVLYPAVAFLGTMVALRIVSLMVMISDDFSAVFINSSQGNVNAFFETVDASIAVSEGDVGKQFIALILSVMLMFAALVTFVMLIIREASIYLATAFMPLSFAMLVWSPLAKWFKKWAQFLIGMILSKILMCAVVAIAVSSLAAAGGIQDAETVLSSPNAPVAASGNLSPPNLDEPQVWMTNVLFAVVLLFMAGAAPFASTKMVSNWGFDGEVAGALGQFSQRPRFRSQLIGIRRHWGNFERGFLNRDNTTLRGVSRQAREAQDAARGTSLADARMKAAGARPQAGSNPKNPQPRDWWLSDAEMDNLRRNEERWRAEAVVALRAGNRALADALDERSRNLGLIIDYIDSPTTGVRSNNKNNVLFAQNLFQAAKSEENNVTFNAADRTINVIKTNERGQQHRTITLVPNVVNRNGRALNRIQSGNDIRRMRQVANDIVNNPGTYASNTVNVMTGSTTYKDVAQQEVVRRNADRLQTRNQRAGVQTTINVLGRSKNVPSYTPPAGLIDGS